MGSVLRLVASPASVISATGMHCRCIKTAVVQEGTIKRRSGRALPSAFHPSFPVPCAQGERRREGRKGHPLEIVPLGYVLGTRAPPSLDQQPKTRLIPFSFKREPERESEPPFVRDSLQFPLLLLRDPILHIGPTFPASSLVFPIEWLSFSCSPAPSSRSNPTFVGRFEQGEKRKEGRADGGEQQKVAFPAAPFMSDRQTDGGRRPIRRVSSRYGGRGTIRLYIVQRAAAFPLPPFLPQLSSEVGDICPLRTAAWAAATAAARVCFISRWP